MRGELFSLVLYAINTEVNFIFIHYLLMCTLCEHTILSLVFEMMPMGKRMRSQRKEVVANVFDYFEELSRCKWTQVSLKRTSDAKGLSHIIIKRLWREIANIGRATFSSPTKRYGLSKCLLVNDFDCEAIKEKIYYIYQPKNR